MKKIVIIGAGAMGSAFTVPCVDNDNDVTLIGTHLENELITSIKKNKNFHPALKTNLSSKLTIERFENLKAIIEKGADVCDFGTGGGLPGMILAIVRPDLRLTLLDSRQKKIVVLQQMIDALKLKNVQTVPGRGEELGKQRPWRHRFPFVTARAVAPLIDLVRWTSDLRKPDSVLHIFKGGEIRNEVTALTKVVSGIKVKKSLMVLKGYPHFAENQKYLISLEFSST